ncbi:MAG: pitrilysin family protein [Myxococcota bacterium]
MRPLLGLWLVLAGCGGTSRLVEIPPLDENVDRLDSGDSGPALAGVAALPRDDLGLAELLELRSASPMVSLRVTFEAGSVEDPPGRPGLTALMARVMVDGAAGARSATAMQETLFPWAAELRAVSGRDATTFVGRVHRDHLEAFTEVFLDVLLRPRFAEEDVDRLRAQQRSALTLGLRANDDESLGKELLHQLLYEDHPYALPPLGTASGLDAATAEELRAHAAAVLCPGRMRVGVSGDLPEGFGASLLAQLEARDGARCVGRRRLPRVAARPRRVLIAHKPEASAVAMSLGVATDVTRDHPDYAALTLAMAYLGQHRTFAGTLMQKIRGERGLNYGDYAYAEHFVQEGWTRFPAPGYARRQQYASLWVRPVDADEAHFALRMAVYELERVVRDGLTEDEFERIRGFVRRYYALYLQTDARRLGFALDDRAYDAPDPFLEGLRAAWASMSAADVNAALRRHVDPAALQIALVAPEAETLKAALVAGDPSPLSYRADPGPEVREEDRRVAPFDLGLRAEDIRIVPAASLFE